MKQKLSFFKPAFFILCFTVCMVMFFFIFITMLSKNPYGIQRSIFFNNLNDFFADFFNLLHDISEREIYARYHGSYFPFSYLILYPFSLVDNFAGMNLEQMWRSRIGLMAAFLFTFFSNVLFFLSLEQLRKKYSLPIYTLIGLFLSSIFFFSIERGNLIILSASGICFYLCYFDSYNKNERMFAMVSLAVSATLKVYPAIYGVLYLQKKQYKELFLCILITLGLVFLPFLFFKGGFSNVPLLVQNMKGMTAAYEPNEILVSHKYYLLPRFSLQHIVYLLSESLIKFFTKTNTDDFALTIAKISFVLVWFSSLLSVTYSIFFTNTLQKISLLTLVLLFFPIPSYLYCGLYIFPIIIIYFSEINKYTLKYNIFIFLVIIILLNPLQIEYSFYFYIANYTISINYILSNILLLILWQILLFTGTRQLMKENIKNENRRFLLVNLFLIVLLVSDIAVILFVSIPQIYSFMIAFLENMIFHKKMNERWHLFGSKAIIIVGIVLIIETTINLMLLNNKKQHKNDIYS